MIHAKPWPTVLGVASVLLCHGQNRVKLINQAMCSAALQHGIAYGMPGPPAEQHPRQVLQHIAPAQDRILFSRLHLGSCCVTKGPVASQFMKSCAGQHLQVGLLNPSLSGHEASPFSIRMDGHVQGGIPKRHCDGLRREVLHTYGHEHVLTLASLQTAGASDAQQSCQAEWA